MGARLVSLILVWAVGAHSAFAQRVAYDEFDGRACAGFAQAGLGEWAQVQGRLEKGRWVVRAGSASRELAQPLQRCVVWYALSLRMRAPIEGQASLAPAADRGSPFSELGFNSEQAGDEGLWSNTPEFQSNGLECTQLVTFLQRYDLAARTWDAWCIAGNGLALLDEQGEVAAAPDVDDAPLAHESLAFLYLNQLSAQELEVERIALAGSAREALTPARPGDPVGPLAAAPAPALADELQVFAGPRGLLRSGDRIAFYGDSITRQGGFIDVIEEALARAAPGKHVEFLRRGVDGATSADLLRGAARAGTNCEPWAQRLAQDQPSAAVIFVGNEDLAAAGADFSPQAYAQNLVALVESARAAGASVVLCTPAWRGQQAQRAPNEDDARLELFAAAARRVAQEQRVGLCDLRAQFVEALSKSSSSSGFGRFTNDGVKLNAAGNQLIAQGIAWAITVQWFREAPEAHLPLLPFPSTLQWDGGQVDVSRDLRVVSRDARGLPAAQALATALGRLDGLRASVGEPPEDRFAIEFVLQEPEFRPQEHAGAEETYTLSIEQNGVRIGGSSPLALARAAATLLQLVGAASMDCAGAQLLALPRLHIFDRAHFAFRGLQLDLARRMHPTRAIEQAIDLCGFYKLGFLQLRLVDDSAFTFPSRSLPELCTPGQSYTREQLRGLSSYAHARGVELIPELALPSCAAQLLALRPDLFAVADKSAAPIESGDPAAVEALKTLLGEVCELFPNSRYVHLGGDEADLEALPQSQHFAAPFGQDSRPAFARLLATMCAQVSRHGRRAMVWDNLDREHLDTLPRDLVVVARDGAIGEPQSLLEAGWTIVNASRQPLQVLDGERARPEDLQAWNAHFWAGRGPESSAGAGLQLREHPRLAGGLFCAFEENDALELESLLPRLAPLSERLWNPGLRSTFADFELRRARSEEIFRRCLAR